MTNQEEIKFRIRGHLEFIYEGTEYDCESLVDDIISAMKLQDCAQAASQAYEHKNLWTEEDTYLITYGDSILEENTCPLNCLSAFYETHLKDTINGIHILPFFPYSSDDGFSVIDYMQVNDSLGTWADIEHIAGQGKLMADLVVNHCSSRGRWFENFKQRKDPGADYFFEASPDDDVSMVVRPRTSPLLREVETFDGKRHVWCTFSHDQVDLNFSNPKVLIEIVNIIRFYLDRGVQTFRLDAVAFVWKELGHPSINHPKTHEIVRLIRSLIELANPQAILITETNVPNHENLSYFGNCNEAHAVYNFSLPPLLFHTLITGNSRALKQWQMSMPPAQNGTFYFNFIASHDGIGLRPAEGLLDEQDVGTMVSTAQNFGGRVSWRTGDDGKDKPYEINITLFDAMSGTEKGPDRWQIPRFICAHAIMLSLEGIPAFYIHSMLATNNNYQGLKLSAQNRTINRYRWQRDELEAALENSSTHHHKVFHQLKKLIDIRTKQVAFHPNATQFTLHLGDNIFGFWRQSMNRDQSIFCIHNISDQEIQLPLSSVNLIGLDDWVDLVSGQGFSDLHQTLTLKPYQFVWLSNQVS